VIEGPCLGYLAVDLNLPRLLTRESLESMWNFVDESSKAPRIAAVTGHRARYESYNYHMLGRQR